jgi:hypothetical protein
MVIGCLLLAHSARLCGERHILHDWERTSGETGLTACNMSDQAEAIRRKLIFVRDSGPESEREGGEEDQTLGATPHETRIIG